MGRLEQSAAEVAKERQQQQQQPCLDVVAAAVVAASCASQERWQQQWRQQWQQLSSSNAQQQQQQQCTSMAEHPSASATLHTAQPAFMQQHASGCSDAVCLQQMLQHSPLLQPPQQQYLKLALPGGASAGNAARLAAFAAAPMTVEAVAAAAASPAAAEWPAAAVLSRKVRRPPRLPAFMQAAGQEQLQPHQLQQQQRLLHKPWQQQLQRHDALPYGQLEQQQQAQQQLALMPLVLQEQQQHRTVPWPSQQQLASPMRMQQHHPWHSMPAGSSAADPAAAAAAAAGVATWGTPQVRRVARLQPRQLSTAPTVVGCIPPVQQQQQHVMQMYAIEQQRQQQEAMQAASNSHAQVLVVDHAGNASSGQPCEWRTPQQVQLLQHHQQQPAAATPQLPPEAAAAAAAVSQPIPAAVPTTPMTQQLLQYELESLQRAEQLMLQLQAALDCRQQQAAALQQHIAQLTMSVPAAAGEPHNIGAGGAAMVDSGAVQQQQHGGGASTAPAGAA
jgi:hypothetical protein